MPLTLGVFATAQTKKKLCFYNNTFSFYVLIHTVRRRRRLMSRKREMAAAEGEGVAVT